MKMRTKALLAAAVVTGIYSAVNGKGPFNKIRFKEQHEPPRRVLYADQRHKKWMGNCYTTHRFAKNNTVRDMRQE